MFTGIIETTAPVLSVLPRKGGLTVRIKTPKEWKLKPGGSVAVDGVCSTVALSGKNFFEVEYMPETLRKTTLGSLKQGVRINLETPLTLNSLVDGHLVQGHVDEPAEVYKVAKDKKGYKVTLRISRELARYVAPHGSVTINGVSFTVSEKKHTLFTVALIPYTLKITNLGRLKAGDQVNVEADILARYLEILRKAS